MAKNKYQTSMYGALTDKEREMLLLNRKNKAVDKFANNESGTAIPERYLTDILLKETGAAMSDAEQRQAYKLIENARKKRRGR